MEHTISRILEAAVRINRQIIEAFLVEEQTKSGYSAQVFFGMLNDEIQVVREKYKSKTEKYEWFKKFDDVLIFLEQNDMLKFFSELDLRIEQFELVGLIVNKLFEQLTLTPKSPETISESAPEKDLHIFLNRLKSDVSEKHFNSMPLSDVIDFFKPLIERTNLGGEVWMTTENFELFIRRSFGHELNLGKPKIKLGSIGKYAIVKLFHKFYSKCMEEDIMENRLTEPFIELLKNAFDTKHFSQFNFKSSKSLYEWD